MPDGTRTRSSIGVPGDREVDMKRLEAVLSPGRARAMDEAATSRSTPRWSRATSGRRCWARSRPQRHPLPRRPARRRRAPAGSPAPTSRAGTCSTSSPAATSPRTARSRRPRSARATCARSAVRPLEIARGIEIGHIFQLGRKYAEALDLKVLDENGKRSSSPWGRTASASRARWPRSPSRPTTSSGLLWPREVAPADVHLVATGKDDAVYAAGRASSRASSTRPVCA